MGEVAGEGRTVLFVSHNMASVEQLCERGLVISQGKIIVDSTSTLAVDYYYSTIRQKGKEIDPQSLAIYENNYIDKTKDVQLVRVEMLDKDNCPIVNLRTWDKLILIIQYWAKTEIRNGSVEIQISDSLGTKLLRFSTQPDSNIPLTIKKGYSQISCEIDKFPLAAGNYWIGCGLAIPNKKWLWFDEKLVMITVQPRDVFKSGLAPNNKRALFVIPHRWTIG